jgi:hypothetical protein
MASNSFRLDSPVLAKPDPATARVAATAALQRGDLHTADGPSAVTNLELNAALDPLRLHPALGVRCGRCDYGIAYLALNTQGTTMVSGNNRVRPKRRRGGVYDLAALDQTDPGTATGLLGWQADAQEGRGTITPTGERAGQRTGFAQRRTHTCEKCGASYTHNNRTLLRLFLEAAARGDRDIRLF